jgi:outer membrane protein assembly factor BamB
VAAAVAAASGSARALLRVATLALLASLIVACSKDKNVEQPAKLTPLNATLRVQRVWGSAVDDKKAAVLRLGLGLSVAGNRVFAAGHRGDVVAFDLASGRSAWRVRLRAPLSGGTAAGHDLVIVGASDGQLFALNPADGTLRWKVRLNGEVLAPAAIGERLLAVRTVDGKLHALAPSDGHELWSQEQQVPRLSLRGTAQPVIAGDVVLCGFDNGKVVAANSSDGSLQWEAVITPPHGRTELERLVDIDSAVSVAGQNVYTVGFQGRVAMLALETGQVWWSHEASSYRGLTLADDALYFATAEGEIVALNARTGEELWRQKALARRGLTAPAVSGAALVTADFQGYVHWLDKSNGALIARASSGKVRVSAQPLIAGDLVLVINDRGQLSAFRATALRAPPPGKKTIPEAPAPTPEQSQ